MVTEKTPGQIYKRSLHTKIHTNPSKFKRMQELQKRTAKTKQAEEDRKNQAGVCTLVDSLQQQLKTYARQLEEAEEVAALNLAKFRKSCQDLDHKQESIV
ncbi:unnamed protein product, partial [Meganyctiphanes norvegica]